MRAKLLLLVFCISGSVYSQKNNSTPDSLNVENKEKFELSLDIVSRYLWRGQCWGGDYIAVQPEVTYEVVPNLVLGFWATTNFQNDYSYPDGTPNKGYQEIDFSISYYFKDFLYINVADYYWPSVEKVPGVDNSFFNYGTNGVKTIDASINLNRTEGDFDYPFKATLSTLIAGNDFKYNSNGENPKQNFTTYLEAGYMFTFFKKSGINICVTPVIGAVLNNKAEYYTYADYGKVSFCNMGIEVLKEFEIGENGFKIPTSLNFIHNAASENTEVFGKNFLVGCLTFKY